MAEKENSTAPQVPNRSVPKGKIKVRVIGKQPINEGGKHYAPETKVAGKVTPADTFETTPERAEALGEHVEIVEQ